MSRQTVARGHFHFRLGLCRDDDRPLDLQAVEIEVRVLQIADYFAVDRQFQEGSVSGMLGIGIGGSAEKAMLLAKESLMDHIDMAQLKQRGPKNKIEELRIELCDKINALGIGAPGLGGLATVLDVKIVDFPTHAASKPIASRRVPPPA